MPEGPLGFPRLTSLGPLVEDKSPQEKMVELSLRPHSYRGYEPDEFIRLLNSGVEKRELRKELGAIEAGRFKDMLEEAYDFWIPLDLDEQETFYERNPDLVRWLEVYAATEELRRPSEEVEI